MRKKDEMGVTSMSVDSLQEKIRKVKNPSVLTLEAFADWQPPEYAGAEGFKTYYRALLAGLKGLVSAVRFGFGSFALLGGAGLETLADLTAEARMHGYYVLLDAPELPSPQAAENLAAVLGGKDWIWDGLVICPWLGSDVIKPFLPLCKNGKALFCAVRTGNRSAAELQDLLSGSRLVHTAAADIVSRLGEQAMGKLGYANLADMASAGSADSLKNLRAKYPRLFLLVDGYDYSFGNSKNCAQAFDKLGRGAAVCAGSSLVAAWKENGEASPADAAVEAAQKMKRNLTRYITVL